MVKNWYFFVKICKKRALFVIFCAIFALFVIFLTILGKVRAFSLFLSMGVGDLSKQIRMVNLGNLVTETGSLPAQGQAGWPAFAKVMAGWDNFSSKKLRYMGAKGRLIGHERGRKKEGFRSLKGREQVIRYQKVANRYEIYLI
jgi:hypothetical protein